jgi:hypothetical protein
VWWSQCGTLGVVQVQSVLKPAAVIETVTETEDARIIDAEAYTREEAYGTQDLRTREHKHTCFSGKENALFCYGILCAADKFSTNVTSTLMFVVDTDKQANR